MAPMQRPDASVSAPRAAGFESISSGFEAVAMVDPYAGQNGQHGDTMTGMAALFNPADLPVGLDLPCAEDPELFFAEAPEDVETAKALCQGCRARTACLEGALDRREPWGVWGGELLLRGTIVPRKRPRGRPRKDSADELTGAASAASASSADERAA
jgi:WhiB family transcriptional regulator, redox-sensing transcriptional regulator